MLTTRAKLAVVKNPDQEEQPETFYQKEGDNSEGKATAAPCDDAFMSISLQRDPAYGSKQEGSYTKSANEDTDFRIVELESGKIKWKGGQEAANDNGE
jgi:hypothetical protein